MLCWKYSMLVQTKHLALHLCVAYLHVNLNCCEFSAVYHFAECAKVNTPAINSESTSGGTIICDKIYDFYSIVETNSDWIYKSNSCGHCDPLKSLVGPFESNTFDKPYLWYYIKVHKGKLAQSF